MSRKELKSWFALLFSSAIAVVWVLGIKYVLFYQPFLPLSSPVKEIEDWLAEVFMITNWINFGAGFLLLFIWIFSAYKKQFVKAKDVMDKRLQWWLCLLAYVGFSLIVFFVISASTGWLEDGRYQEFWMWYPPCSVIDGILLFWIPTALATPRSMRNVPPLAIKLRSLYGG